MLPSPHLHSALSVWMYLSTPSITKCRGLGWSRAVAAKDIRGMACMAGLLVSCHSHSAAIARANARVGSTITRLAGVRTGYFPSQREYPDPEAAGATETVWKKRLCPAAFARLLALSTAASSASAGVVPGPIALVLQARSEA